MEFRASISAAKSPPAPLHVGARGAEVTPSDVRTRFPKETVHNMYLRNFCLFFLVLVLAPWLSVNRLTFADVAVFNVKDYGATGRKADDAHAAVQKAVDACAAAGGGMVYLPPGEYTSGTIKLKSHVRFHIEAGATLFASLNRTTFDKGALSHGEGLENISLEGRGL